MRNMQIEKEEIDHVAMNKAIGEIAQDAGQQKRQRHVSPKTTRMLPNEEGHNDEKCNRRNYDEEPVVSPERSKSCARVRHVNQTKEIRYYSERLIGVNEPQDDLFCPLIERVKR